jgi:hypothetical protein
MGQLKKLIVKKRILNLDGTNPINYYGSHQQSINKGFFFNLFFCDGPTEETPCKKRILNLDGTDPTNYYGSHQHSINKGFLFNVVKNALYLLGCIEMNIFGVGLVWITSDHIGVIGV